MVFKAAVNFQSPTIFYQQLVCYTIFQHTKVIIKKMSIFQLKGAECPG